MTLLFDHPAGLWALAAVPAIVTIHFLRPAARRERVSTLFLLEHLDPGEAKSRRLLRLRTTAAFWLQIVAALLLAWLLAEPRWLRAGSRQTVAVVLDCSASMRPFRAAAEAALRTELTRWSRAADRTTWLVRESDSRRAPLYQGESQAAALAALDRWQPNLGEHELTATLGELQYAFGASTPVLLVTDHRTDAPPGTTVLGVGAPLPNTGFAGAAVEDTADGLRWRVLVQHRGGATARNTLRVLDRNGRELAPARALELTEGTVLSIEGAFPAGGDALQLALESDRFAPDDRLPLVRPRERALRWAGGAEPPELFKRLAASLEFATRDATAPEFRLLTATGPQLPALAPGGELVAAKSAAADSETKIATASVAAERHPLVEGLSWDGLLSAGPAALQPAAGATVLLWQGDRELAWLESSPAAVRLVLNFDVARSNAERLPAFVVLLNRFVATVRTNLRQPSAVNVETHQRLDLGEGWRRGGETLVATGGTVNAGIVTAPGEPGFFTVRDGETDVLVGAARFGDVREADFRGAESFVVEGRSVAEAARAASQPDPWRPVWLLAAVGCLLGIAAVTRRRGADVARVPPRERHEHPTSNIELPTSNG